MPPRSVTLTARLSKCFNPCSLKTRSPSGAFQLSALVLQLRFTEPSTSALKPVWNGRTGTSITQSCVPKLQPPIPQKLHTMQQCWGMLTESLDGRLAQSRQIWVGIRVKNRSTQKRGTRCQAHRTQSRNVLH